MRDDEGIVQLWTISPNGGMPRQVTQLTFDVASAFSWHPDGKHIAFAADNSIWLLTVAIGSSQRLTARTSDDTRPQPEACAFSPDGRQITFVRPVKYGSQHYNQVFVTKLDPRTISTVHSKAPTPVSRPESPVFRGK
jgi:Tol biopolymer transport system component